MMHFEGYEKYALWNLWAWSNGLVSQMQAHLAACREPEGKLWEVCKVFYVFEHKWWLGYSLFVKEARGLKEWL